MHYSTRTDNRSSTVRVPAHRQDEIRYSIRKYGTRTSTLQAGGGGGGGGRGGRREKKVPSSKRVYTGYSPKMAIPVGPKSLPLLLYSYSYSRYRYRTSFLAVRRRGARAPVPFDTLRYCTVLFTRFGRAETY